MTVVAVADTGPLIHLAEIDSLALLSLVDRLYVPEVVYGELESGGVPEGIGDVDCVVVNVDGESIGDLDPGESAALALAMRRDAVLLTDDLEARERAGERGVEVHGSIGLIALGYARGRLDREDAASLIRSLQRETSLFVTDAVVERGIEMLDDR